MRTFYLVLALSLGASAPASVLAQTTPALPITPTQTPPSKVEITKSTLFKLGTGLTRGFEWGGYSGLAVPVVLGVEHHLTPAISLYGNLFGGLNIGRRSDYNQSLLRTIGADAGVRYYYNQEKRKEKGRATGPFVGNYFALQTTSSFYSNHPQNSLNEAYRYQYDNTSLSLLWGAQRRVGKHGLFDAYVGAGLENPQFISYRNGYPEYKRQLGIKAAIGVKISLIP
ncbi:DUF3575 domain-containing protein [Hymenobacter taeanensis]|uniref:DUF3575 domain-containing protein n=1 Tax=Hymenobacter taeanensis TaxID=2735321 RepID=A0A6M6BGT4_9BACT|nr:MULTISPECIES: DUF3575 domain-containing protein [Hymenobacter]QJX47014.1 DUF3575 domain-containing protein [Hymenobacter taeanensis]UOQ80892.1 DUF3575 domain-containing protein [Hymenobacter sp. 5414T-23]